jgi:hypothetical protein
VFYFLKLNKKKPGFEADFESVTMAHSSKEIEKITKRLKIKHLFEFFSFAEQNHLCPAEYQETKTPWFAAQEGIDWLEAVMGQIRSKPSCVKEPDELLADLSVCANILRKAKRIQARWHFGMDI